MSRFAFALAIVAFLASGMAQSQGYPDRPIRLLIPFAAGGTADIVGRTVGKHLSDVLGKPVVIDNRTGAGGVIATGTAARATPDGYTLLISSAANAANVSLVRDLPYDFEKDLAPITLVVLSPYILIVNPGVPAKSVGELIGVARAKPGALNFASTGYGTSQHLAGVLFNMMAGTRMAYITYKGAAATIPDLIGGRVQLLFSGIPAALPHVKSGRLRALAVTSEKRSAGMPDLPTVGEDGLPGYSMTAWHGLLAPSGTPLRVITRLNKTVTEGIASREMRDLFIGMGLEPVGDSPSQHKAFISSEIGKISKLVRDADLKPE